MLQVLLSVNALIVIACLGTCVLLSGLLTLLFADTMLLRLVHWLNGTFFDIFRVVGQRNFWRDHLASRTPLQAVFTLLWLALLSWEPLLSLPSLAL